MGNEQLTDRELDALVAEKVMGWTKTRQGRPHYNDHEWCGFPPAERRLLELPDYSTNISDAMEVVEKMREQGFAVVMDSRSGKWWAEFSNANRERAATNESLPRAICLAALAAVG